MRSRLVCFFCPPFFAVSGGHDVCGRGCALTGSCYVGGQMFSAALPRKRTLNDSVVHAHSTASELPSFITPR